MEKFKSLNEKVKEIKETDMYEIALRKWPSILSWVERNHWAWFVSAAIIFTIKPMKRFLEEFFL